MEMYYLFVYLTYSSLIMPEKYTKEQCEQAANDIKQGIGHICVKAPSIPLNCRVSKSTNTMNCEN